MFWDKLFWLWFLFAAIVLMYFTMRDPSRTNMLMALVLIGIGILKLAEESNRGKGISKKILEKLWK